uniref:Peptidase A1 domain-containing protein n=1 Tax=Kalanchoe fedtschenkoi TaxID=63787 RepID=A0A7N0V947_KALFE
MASFHTFLSFYLLGISLVLASKNKDGASFRPKALIVPVTKDAATSQYLTHIKQRTPLVDVQLVVDLGGQFLWVDCETRYVSSSYKAAHCRTAVCSLAGSDGCGTCFSPPSPGCNNNTCGLIPYNEIIRTSTSGEVAQDVVSVHSTDGASPGPVVSVPSFIFTCAPTFLLEGLAKGSKGIAGLGRGRLGMPSLFASAFSFRRKFAVCLGTKGFIIFGDGPYRLLPGNMDVSQYLTYTPLILNPVSTAGTYSLGDKSTDYFIGVTAIHINKTPVNLNATLLTIDPEGRGGTKLSTVQPYTVMETSIYHAVISAFRKAAAPIKTVSSVSPFGLCYSTKSFSDTYLGPAVPQIDLILQSSGTKWYIYGANSMVRVSDSVMCLGIVDGGVTPTTSIVVGAYQLDEYLLQFDLAASRLGFSVSMRSTRTSCSNFNFTSIA